SVMRTHRGYVIGSICPKDFAALNIASVRTYFERFDKVALIVREDVSRRNDDAIADVYAGTNRALSVCLNNIKAHARTCAMVWKLVRCIARAKCRCRSKRR